MPVIAHNAIAAYAHRKPLYTLGNDLLEREKVANFLKYAQPSVGPVEHVVNVSA